MPLYLLADEKTLFASMKPELTGGWVVEEETLSFEDSDTRRAMRFSLLRLHDSLLLKTREKILAAKTEEQFRGELKTLDFSKIGNSDFSRLLYALGPDALGMMVQDVLLNVSSKSDLELAAALSGLRHLMLEALIEADF